MADLREILTYGNDLEQIGALRDELGTALQHHQKQALILTRTLAYIDNHIKHLSNPEVEFSWPGFVDFVQSRDSVLGGVLLSCESTTFDVGRLRIKAGRTNKELLIARRAKLEELLLEFAGTPYKVEILTNE